jgi:tRNA threonylcarbamoyl adenosine modification protein YeaZ
MTYYLTLQNNYNQVEVALFWQKERKHFLIISKVHASARIVYEISQILKSYRLAFSDLSFLSANCGPGPFTTLRVVISTINGLGFSSQLPLIGVDCLDAFLDEYHDARFSVTVALLNAFSQDAFFGIQANNERVKGCKNIELLLHELKARCGDTPVRFIGLGVVTFKKQIDAIMGKSAVIPDPLPEYCSINAVGIASLALWEKKINLRQELQPLYLK